MSVPIHEFVIQQHVVEMSDTKVIPRLAHVIWLYDKPRPLEFYHDISLLAIQTFINLMPSLCGIRTSLLLVRGGHSYACTSQIWNSYTLIPLNKYNGQPISDATHQSDVMWLEVLIHFGGLYVELDVVLLKPLDALMTFNLTQGTETPNRLGSGFILAAKNTRFLSIWDGQYRTFNDNDWNGHTVMLPMELAMTYKQTSYPH